MKTVCELTLISSSPDLLNLDSRITAISFSPNGSYIAIGTVSKVVSIYHIRGERIDGFSLKPNTTVNHERLSVQSLRFCPDQRYQKIAVAQSDFTVSIFSWCSKKESKQLNTNVFTGKKSICNRFSESSSVIHLIWPQDRPFEVVYGLLNGTVKRGCLKSNKSKILYKVDSPMLAMALHCQSKGVTSAHSNGGIYVHLFHDEKRDSGSVKVAQHSRMINTISWGRSIFVGGSKGMFSLYNESGKEEIIDTHNHIENELIHDHKYSDFNSVSFNASGDCVAIGCFNYFYIFKWNSDKNIWEQQTYEKIDHVLSITVIEWSNDSSTIAIGTSSGFLNLYNVYLRRYIYNTDFDVVHVSENQIIVHNRFNEEYKPIFLNAKGARQIKILKTYPEPGRENKRFIVAHTDASLLLCDTDPSNPLVSEVTWQGDTQKVRFLFDAINACMISFAGELSVVELGKNEILGTVRTEFMSSHLLSLRISSLYNLNHQESSKTIHEVKKIACLLDKQTICVMDFLKTSSTTFNHTDHIDFLELNMKGNLLIFRDKKEKLHLFDVSTQTRKTLLASCSYVQWVPDSDTIVAQQCQHMFVWYDPRSFDKFSSREIKGKVVGIERMSGKTEVLTRDTSRAHSYILSEDLIRFRCVLDDGSFGHAAKILECMNNSLHSESMWRQLFDESLKNWDISVAARCAAALGDLSKVKYLRAMSKIAERLRTNGVHVASLWNVQVLMCKLKRNIDGAEDIFISHHKINEAVEMYEEIEKFPDALRLMEKYELSDFEDKKEKYLKILLNTGQEGKAAKLTYEYGDCVRAIHLYLNAHLPGKAASIIFENKIAQPIEILQSVFCALKDSGSYKKAGDVSKELGQVEDALACYLQSHSYQEAVELARIYFPGQVTSLEEKWGDYLISTSDHFASVKHFLEAHKYSKAVNAAIQANKWEDAASIAEKMNDSTVDNSFESLANHFQASGSLEKAAFFYLKAKNYLKLVRIFFDTGNWSEARKVSHSYLSEAERYKIYVEQASLMEKGGRFKIAESLLMEVNEYEKIINMFLKHRHFQKAIEVASKCSPSRLEETNKSIAKCLEKEGNLFEAEKYYRASGDWSLITEMYRKNNLWNEAIRSANNSGDLNERQKIAYHYAVFLESSAADKLHDLSLLDPALEYALSENNFDLAHELAQHKKSDIKVEEILLKKAVYLKSKGAFREAESNFIKAMRPEDAVQMYIENKNWIEAERIAKVKCKSMIGHIYDHRANIAIEEKKYEHAEQLYLQSGNPMKVVSMYKSLNFHNDANRIIHSHLSNLSEERTPQLSSFENTNTESIEECLKFVRLHEKDNDIIQKIKDSLSSLFVNKDNLDVTNTQLSKIFKLARFDDPDARRDFANILRKQISQHRQRDPVDTDAKCTRVILDKSIDNQKFCSTQYAECSRSDLSVQKGIPIFLSKEEKENSAQQSNQINETNVEILLDGFVKEKKWDILWNNMRDNLQIYSREVLKKYAGVLFEHMKETNEPSDLNRLIELLWYATTPIFDVDIDFYIYLDLVQMTFNLTKDGESKIDMLLLVTRIKDVLRKRSDIQSKDTVDKDEKNENETINLQNLTMAVHYTQIMYRCDECHLSDLAAKCAITLFQYCYFWRENGTRLNLIPVDKAFYNAGHFCQKSNHQHLAFLFFNRYIDIVEAINTDESEQIIPNLDFKSTMLAKDDMIPIKHYITNEGHQDYIRDWVLSKCMDSTLERSLPDRNEVSEGSIYSGLYSWLHSRCIVTGYPIPVINEVTKEEKKANIQDWNDFVRNTDCLPWSGKKI